eukprot:25537_1
MATYALLLSLWTYIAHVTSQNFNYTNFKTLGITLPKKLRQHISAVYNNKLYVFGGVNTTILEPTAFSTLYWSLDLSQLNLELSSSKNDIDTSTLNTGEGWQQLSIVHPSYGTADSTGIMRCIHQCSVLVDQYLYIVAPYGRDITYTTWAYRLDLSASPPAFSAANEFESTLPSSIKEPCVTASHDKSYLYLVGGDEATSGDEADNTIRRYTISTDQWDELPSMNENRQSAGCAMSYNDKELYIFGGKSKCPSTPCSTTFGSKTIDTYNVETRVWTNNGAINSPELPKFTSDLQCVSNLYDETILCPGGIAQRSYDDTIIYRTPTKKIVDTVYLSNDTSSYGMATYEFVNAGNDQAKILLITGGHNGDLEVYDTIQYTVIYNVPTQAPTSAPTAAPTLAPSDAPSAPPTLSPSDAPSQPPTRAPSFNPTEIETTEEVTRQGTASEKQTETWGQDPSNASQHNLIGALLLSIIALCCVAK